MASYCTSVSRQTKCWPFTIPETHNLTAVSQYDPQLLFTSAKRPVCMRILKVYGIPDFRKGMFLNMRTLMGILGLMDQKQWAQSKYF